MAAYLNFFPSSEACRGAPSNEMNHPPGKMKQKKALSSSIILIKVTNLFFLAEGAGDEKWQPSLTSPN